MFKITCMVEDKNLALLLRTLASARALNVESVPVVNAAVKNGTVVPQGRTGACSVILGTFGKGEKFTSTAANKALKAAGMAPNSAALKRLVKSGQLKKAAGGYVVL